MEDDQIVKRLVASGVPHRWRNKSVGLVATFSGNPDAAPLLEFMAGDRALREDGPEVIQIETGQTKGSAMKAMDLGYAVTRQLALDGRAVKCAPLHEIRQAVLASFSGENEWWDLRQHEILVIQGADDGKRGELDDWALDWALVDWLNEGNKLVLVTTGPFSTCEGWSWRLRELVARFVVVNVKACASSK